MPFYEVDFWMYSGSKDDYDNHTEKIKAISNKNAVKKIQQKYPRAKNLIARLIASKG